ncbi:dicarboxylate/amino acid:cation symporter [Horticoccus luteus]|uniref:Dicarboxylate/amino acid:cation symporter n=1 Tax=Horticoccus luteus TaxID=2862869 RepID=A0A8F9XKL1_9BACT|nr:dicarboxylate/amino acid:cation symporter [Horticoccus luteus]QYM78311.1 dicarboxylate/amino acid:cation symporter [Horticoccus luteus]
MASSNTPLANKILAGLAVGVVAGLLTLALGHFAPAVLTGARLASSQLFDPLGQVFLRLLFFVVIPLVFASLTVGVVQLGRLDRLGPLAGRTFTLFFANMAIGVGLGLIMMNVLRPGNHLADDAKARLLAEYGGAAQQHIATHAAQPSMNLMTLVEMFMPKNLLGAVAGHSNNILGEVLPLILFGILVGAVGTQLSEEKRQRLQSFLELIAELMTGIVHFALKLAPYAVAAMIYSVVVKVGTDILVALGVFVLGCIAVMLLHLFGTMSIWLKMWTTRSPAQFWRDIRTVLVTAFSTSSSNATLPAALDCARDTLKIQPSVAGFVLPLGTTMNMSGTALYEGCVVLFVAQVFGVELSLVHQIVLLVLAVFSAVAVAGIPGGSLPLIAGLLVTFGIPAEGIGIVLGADRILDMMRTMINVGSDMVTTAVVDAQVLRAEARRAVA